MLIPRVIPTLLLMDEGFVKTSKFKNEKYIGDPVNVINLFNRFEVDEIVLLDIKASLEGRSPNLALLQEIAQECWVPLAYGGGLHCMKDVEAVFRIGVEKLIFNTALKDNPDLITQASNIYGSQAIVVSIDTQKRRFGGYAAYVKNGTEKLPMSPVELATYAQELGAGEIFVNCIDRDGTMKGYDIDIIRDISQAVDVPVVACGGARDREDLPTPIQRADASAVAAGTIFVFKGPEKGVLINFPERDELERLMVR